MFDDLPLTLAVDTTGAGGGEGPQSIGTDTTSTTAPPTTQGGGLPARGGGAADWTFPLFFLVIIAVFWFVLMGGQRKEKRKRAKMLAALSKGDKVQTLGGIIGSVVEVREHEVVLKVDENSNTRIKFSRAAIQAVLSAEEQPSKDKADK